MSVAFSTHLLAVASGTTLIAGLILIFCGRKALQRLQIPDREDDAEGFARADALLKRGILMLRSGDVIGVIGGLGVILTMLMYAGILPAF